MGVPALPRCAQRFVWGPPRVRVRLQRTPRAVGAPGPARYGQSALAVVVTWTGTWNLRVDEFAQVGVAAVRLADLDSFTMVTAWG